MKNFKELILENKKILLLSAAITLSVFIVFTVIAVIASNGDDESKSKKADNKVTSTEKEKEETTEKTTVKTDSEEGKIDEVETSVVAPVDETKIKYAIKVNRALNCITIYQKDNDGKYTVPFKAITCSTGKNIGDTPIGSFKTIVSYNWLLMVDGSFGQYAYRFYGPILFHSVPYFSKNKGDLEFKQYNLLGGPASLGCVRVNVRDAIWLIENCPIGTSVEIYDDLTSPGPLGKPDSIKIPEDSPYRGWDPTDPDPLNPWHNFGATISVSSTKVNIYRGSNQDAIITGIGAVAKDTCGNIINNKIVVSGGIDYNKTGNYLVTLEVTDAIGSNVKLQIEVNVIENTVAPTASSSAQTSETKNTTAQTEATNTTEATTTTGETTPTSTETTAETSTDTTTEEATTTVDNNIG